MSNHVYRLRLTDRGGAEWLCTWLASRPCSLKEFQEFFPGRKAEIVGASPSQVEGEAQDAT